jgi:hypothetical protein
MDDVQKHNICNKQWVGKDIEWSGHEPFQGTTKNSPWGTEENHEN